jgi:hypothetical protein
MEPKKKQILGIPFQTFQQKRKQLEILFRGAKKESNSRNSVPNHSAEIKLLRVECRGRLSDQICCASFLKLHFFAEFHSVPFRALESELGMPRNEHFLPRNNGNRSESVLQNFFETKFRSQPYSACDEIGSAYAQHAIKSFPRMLSICML